MYIAGCCCHINDNTIFRINCLVRQVMHPFGFPFALIKSWFGVCAAYAAVDCFGFFFPLPAAGRLDLSLRLQMAAYRFFILVQFFKVFICDFFCLLDVFCFSGCVCLYVCRIRKKQSAVCQTLFYAYENNFLKDIPKKITAVETAAPVLGNCRMVWNLTIISRPRNQRYAIFSWISSDILLSELMP